jgi:predicted nucleic acid-binding protein
MSLLFDSNVFIYHLNGALGHYGQSLLKQGLVGEGSFSVISRIEVMGFSQPPEELEKASRLFAALNQIELNAQIVTQTIVLRQLRKIKIADAIIAASALHLGLPLVTHNTRDFQWIAELELIDPLAESSP